MQYIERLKSVPVKVRTFSFVKFHFALEKLLIRHFLHDITGCNALLVFLHNHQIAVWDFLQNLLVNQVKVLHERRNLPQQAVVAYWRCFAVMLATFLAKADSRKKSFVDRRE